MCKPYREGKETLPHAMLQQAEALLRSQAPEGMFVNPNI